MDIDIVIEQKFPEANKLKKKNHLGAAFVMFK